MNKNQFDQFWEVYPNKKGKGAARKAYEKVMQGNDEDAMLSDILLALEAQKRYRREAQSTGEFLPPWKHPSTWLNQECWMDEIDSHAELKQSQELKICSMPGCDEMVHGPRFVHCAYHIEFNEEDKLRDVIMAPELRDYYNKHPEIHGLKGPEAVKWIKGQIRGIGK